MYAIRSYYGSGTQKDAACAAIDPDNQKCTTVIDAGIAGSPDDKEVAVVSSAGSANELNLAYTCVLVSQNTVITSYSIHYTKLYESKLGYLQCFVLMVGSSLFRARRRSMRRVLKRSYLPFLTKNSSKFL